MLGRQVQGNVSSALKYAFVLKLQMTAFGDLQPGSGEAAQ